MAITKKSKVCILSDDEVRNLLERNVRPDCTKGKHGHASAGKAAEMQLTGDIAFVDHYFVPTGTYARRVKSKKSSFSQSSASIKARDIMANAGLLGQSSTEDMSEMKRRQLLADGRLKRREDRIEQTRGKVALWNFLGDDKAIRVAIRPDLSTIQRVVKLQGQAKEKEV
jgi:hypothetical protein